MQPLWNLGNIYESYSAEGFKYRLIGVIEMPNGDFEDFKSFLQNANKAFGDKSVTTPEIFIALFKKYPNDFNAIPPGDNNIYDYDVIREYNEYLSSIRIFMSTETVRNKVKENEALYGYITGLFEGVEFGKPQNNAVTNFDSFSWNASPKDLVELPHEQPSHQGLITKAKEKNQPPPADGFAGLKIPKQQAQPTKKPPSKKHDPSNSTTGGSRTEDILHKDSIVYMPMANATKTYNAKTFINEANDAILKKTTELKNEHHTSTGKNKYEHASEEARDTRQAEKLKNKQIYNTLTGADKPELKENAKNEAIFVPMRPTDAETKDDIRNATTINIDAIRSTIKAYAENYGQKLYSIEAVLHTNGPPPKEYENKEYQNLTDEQCKDLLKLCAETMIAGAFPALSKEAYSKLVEYSTKHDAATLSIGDLKKPLKVAHILVAISKTMGQTDVAQNKWANIKNLSEDDFKHRERNVLQDLLKSDDRISFGRNH